MKAIFVPAPSSGNFAKRLMAEGVELQSCPREQLREALAETGFALLLVGIDDPVGLQILREQRSWGMSIAYSCNKDEKLVREAIIAGAADWIDAETDSILLRRWLTVIEARFDRRAEDRRFVGSQRLFESKHAAIAHLEDEKEQTVENLARGYYLYRDMVECAADMIWTVDNLGRVVYASPLLGRTLGYNKDEIWKRPIDQFIREEDRDFCIKAFQNHTENKPVPPYELHLLAKDGRTIPVEVASSTLYRTDGSVQGVQSVLRDISKRASLEESLARRVQIQNLIGVVSSNLLEVSLDHFQACFQDSLKAIAQYTGADRCHLRILANSPEFSFENTSARFEWNVPGLVNQISREMNENRLPWIFDQLKRMQPLYFANLADLPDEAAIDRETFKQLGWQSYLAVPLSRSNKMAGFISLCSATLRSWPDHYLTMLRTLGEMLAGAFNRVQAMNDLKKSEKKYRTLVENALDGIALITDSRFEYANPAFLQFVDLDQQSLACADSNAFFSLEHLERIARDNEEGRIGVAQSELKLKRQSGGTVDTLVSAAFVDIGDSRAILGFFKDITALNEASLALDESNARYRVLVENATVGICMAMDRTLVYANQALLNMLNYSEEEFRQLPLKALFAPEDPAGTGNVSLFGESTPNRREVLVQTKEGQIINVLLSSGRIDLKGKPSRIMMLQDITELKMAQHNLQNARDELERRVKERTADLLQANTQLQEEVVERDKAELRLRASLKEKDILLREVHHRVKNNLQIILSLLQLQQDYLHEPSSLRILSDIRDRIYCMGLVHEILCRSQDISNIDVSEYIRTLASNLVFSYKGKSGSVGLDVETSKVVLTIDSAIAIGLIVNELVSNALKHAFAGKEKGQLKIQLFRNDLQRLVLVVTDDGIGVPENFELQNVESLGLQLVQALAHQLEGTLVILSHHGTTFRIEFST